MTGFLLEAVLISLSGVMAPGPLSAAVVARGARSRHAGALAAVGHGLVELPLVALIGLGFGHWVEAPYVQPAVAAAGGALLLWMGAGLGAGLLRTRRSGRTTATTGGPAATDAGAGGASLWTGIVLSAGNPYFLVWWLTVGAALLWRAAEHGGAGIAAFAAAHWLCDLLWLWFLSAAVHGGSRILGPRFDRAVPVLCAVVLVWMGVVFLADAGGALLRLRDGS